MGVILRSPGSPCTLDKTRYWEVFWSLTKARKKLPTLAGCGSFGVLFGLISLIFHIKHGNRVALLGFQLSNPHLKPAVFVEQDITVWVGRLIDCPI